MGPVKKWPTGNLETPSAALIDTILPFRARQVTTAPREAAHAITAAVSSKHNAWSTCRSSTGGCKGFLGGRTCRMKMGTGESLTATVKRPPPPRLGLAAAFRVLPAAPYILRSSTLPLQVSEAHGRRRHLGSPSSSSDLALCIHDCSAAASTPGPLPLLRCDDAYAGDRRRAGTCPDLLPRCLHPSATQG